MINHVLRVCSPSGMRHLPVLAFAAVLLTGSTVSSESTHISMIAKLA